MSRRRRYKLPPPIVNLPDPCHKCAELFGKVQTANGVTWCGCERGKLLREQESKKLALNHKQQIRPKSHRQFEDDRRARAAGDRQEELWNDE